MIKNKKVLMSIIILFFVISINTIVSAKYVIEYTEIIGKICIDRSPPFISVLYSSTEPTGDDVIVTLVANEKVQPLEGWQISEDKMQLSKIYEKNIREDVVIKDLFGNEVSIGINIENIDKEKPKIELVEIKNTNINFEKYANKTHEITFRIKLIEKNIKENNLEVGNINLQIGEKAPYSPNVEIIEISKEKDEIVYDVKVTNLDSNGLLKLIIKDSIIMDIGVRTNEEFVIDSGIQIDNIMPEADYRESLLYTGKVEISINANEKIRQIEGWDMDETSTNASKEFLNNIEYSVEIEDYAQNKAEMKIKVMHATYIDFKYCTHDSEIGWDTSNFSTDIAGDKAIDRDTKLKVEAFGIHIDGNIEKDFLKARAFVYSYWGENSSGVCVETGEKYNYGYNPSENGYKTMETDGVVEINGENYMLFGGTSMNRGHQTDANGNNPIPTEEASQYKYGISGIQLDLKDYSYYSIIYQIYVDEVGWLSPKSDGEEAMYSYDKPITAIRVDLVPKSEKEEIIKLWN